MSVKAFAKDTAVPRTVIELDPFKSPTEQTGTHNRWHSSIPAVAHVKQGETFRVHCVDWTGGQIGNTDNSDDIRDVDLSTIHNLSGPIAVEGAEPGDALVVEILDVQPFPQMPWGYTGIFDLDNGGGLFAVEFGSKAVKGAQLWNNSKRCRHSLMLTAIWDLEGVYATSRHVPGVRFAGIPHPGLMGTAPSQELLDVWNKRERLLIENEQARHYMPVAHPPLAKGAHVGQPDLPEEIMQKVAREGARTVPPREHGGNVDIRRLSRGSTSIYPVYISGANLSVGDLHFSQGDGEITFCGAIEMAGIITLKCSVLKGGVKKLGLRQPMFRPSPVDPLYSDQLIFQGISVDLHGDGQQYYNDATVAFKQACLNAIEYLMRLGYTREQAYIILSAGPIESHIAAAVDVPNACCTVAIPTAIFDQDISPLGPLEHKSRGQAAVTTS